jgi:hypothetical protein
VSLGDGGVGPHPERAEEERDARRGPYRVRYRLGVRVHAHLGLVVPGQPQHPAAGDVRDDHDELVLLRGGQRAARVSSFQVGPGVHVLLREDLPDPVVQEIAAEQPFVPQQPEDLGHLLERPPEEAARVLELGEVQVGHDGLHLRGVVAGGQHRGHDGPGGRAGYPVDRIRLRRRRQRGDGTRQARSLDATPLQDQVSIGHIRSPLSSARAVPPAVTRESWSPAPCVRCARRCGHPMQKTWSCRGGRVDFLSRAGAGPRRAGTSAPRRPAGWHHRPRHAARIRLRPGQPLASACISGPVADPVSRVFRMRLPPLHYQARQRGPP